MPAIDPHRRIFIDNREPVADDLGNKHEGGRRDARAGLGLAFTFGAGPARGRDCRGGRARPDHHVVELAGRAAKKDWVAARVREFEATNKQCAVKLSFIPKADNYTQAKSAVRTGQAPDVFYLEPDQPEFWRAASSTARWPCRLGQVRGLAKPAWTYKGKVYGPAGRGLHGRALLQQGSGEEGRRRGAAVLSADTGRLRGSGQEGGRGRHHARVAGRRRPAVPGRPAPVRVAPAQAGRRGLREAPERDAVLQGSARPGGDDVVQGAGGCRRLPEELRDAEARRVALLLLPEAGRPDLPGSELVHGTRLRLTGERRYAGELPLGIMQFPAMDDGQCPTCKTLAVAAAS